MQLPGIKDSERELRLRMIRNAKGPWHFVILIFSIQICITWANGPNAVSWIYESFGLSRSGLSGGRIWQLLTYALLHGGIFHTLVNSVWVMAIGSRVEQIVGTAGFWKCLAMGTLGGAAGHLLVAESGRDEGILVGVSGGCMALLILLTTLSPDSRMWPLPVSARNLGIGIMGTEFFLAICDPKLGLPVFSGIGLAFSALGFGSWFAIGHACHFGGGLAGFLMGRWLLRPRMTVERLRRERERREARQVRP